MTFSPLGLTVPLKVAEVEVMFVTSPVVAVWLAEVEEDELETVSALATAAACCSMLLSVVLLALFKLNQSQKPALASLWNAPKARAETMKIEIRNLLKFLFI